MSKNSFSSASRSLYMQSQARGWNPFATLSILMLYWLPILWLLLSSEILLEASLDEFAKLPCWNRHRLIGASKKVGARNRLAEHGQLDEAPIPQLGIACALGLSAVSLSLFFSYASSHVLVHWEQAWYAGCLLIVELKKSIALLVYLGRSCCNLFGVVWCVLRTQP